MERTPTKSQVSSYASDPNLSINKEDNSGQIYINRRFKRCREGDFESTLEQFKSDFTALLSAWKDEQNAKFSEFQSDFQSIKSQLTEVQRTNNEIERSIDQLASQFGVLTVRVDSMEKRTTSHDQKIRILEQRTEEMSRKSCLNVIEIRNIPRTPKETQDQLVEIAAKIMKHISIDLNAGDIMDIRRLHGRTEKRVILMTLSTVILKNKILESVKLYNTKSQIRLNTDCLNLPIPTEEIYIYEHLTAKARRLFYLGRELVRAGQFRYCWTVHGRVLLRKQEGSPFILATDEDQLEGLKKTTSQ